MRETGGGEEEFLCGFRCKEVVGREESGVEVEEVFVISASWVGMGIFGGGGWSMGLSERRL